MNLVKSKTGFTLIELIIVIAILGILAGTAIPVYSGYVRKADEVKDARLLSVANAAIAAACTENGVAFADADDYLKFTADTDNMAGDTITFKAKDSGDKATAVFAYFKVYHGSDKIEFEYYDGVEFDTGGNLKPVEPTA